MVGEIHFACAQFRIRRDEVKAAANILKYGVSFELASSIPFGDPRVLTLAAAYLWTDLGSGLIKVRLISALRATAAERLHYTDSQ